MEPRWMRNGIMAHGTGPAKQRWTCFSCKEKCSITIGLNEEPADHDKGVCHEANTATLPKV